MEIEIERGGEADKQEQWSPLCALIWARYSSSLTLTHINSHPGGCETVGVAPGVDGARVQQHHFLESAVFSASMEPRRVRPCLFVFVCKVEERGIHV